MLFSSVSAECAVICTNYFEVVLHTTLSLQLILHTTLFQGKGANYRKETCLPFVWGDNFCL